MFNHDKLISLDCYKVGLWDEFYRKCSLVIISGANRYNHITQVSRDEHNNPSLLENDNKDAHVNVNIKYKKEARFALGAALVERLDGVVERKRIPLFDYTEKNVIKTGSNSTSAV